VSGASTTAAVANTSAQGKLSPDMSGVATVVTSMASALVNVPLVYRETRQKEVTRSLSFISFVRILIGLTVLLVRERVSLW
jgi:hypothetical protein